MDNIVTSEKIASYTIGKTCIFSRNAKMIGWIRIKHRAHNSGLNVYFLQNYDQG